MAQITIEVPDELLPRLIPYSSRLPDVLSGWLDALEPVSGLADGSPTTQQMRGVYESGLYREMVDFLMSQPSPQDLLNYRVSAGIQARLGELLGRSREARLTVAEQAELSLYEQLDQIMRMLKIRAFAMLKENANASAVRHTDEYN